MKLPWQTVSNLSTKVQDALRYLETSSAADYSRREEVVSQLGASVDDESLLLRSGTEPVAVSQAQPLRVEES